MNASVALRASTAMLLMIATMPAGAQAIDQKSDQAAAQPAEEVQPNSSDIIVTASRRAERLAEVPQSITAVTGEDLARLNATQLRDYFDTVPGLSVNSGGGAGQNQLTLRGVTSGSDIASTVGIYVDDVPYGGSTVFSINTGLALDAGLFDLDRLEVLRGPQGTLYGASSMGGLLKYVTRRPDLTEVQVSAQTGVSFTKQGGASYDASAGISAPIVTDKVAVRASGYYSHDGGYIDNVTTGERDVGRANIYGGRLDLLLQPTDRLSVRLSGFAQNIHRDGSALVDYTASGRLQAGDLTQQRALRESFDQKFRVVSGTINYDLGVADVTSITSYQTNDVRIRTDGSALYVPILALAGLPVAATASEGGISTDKFTQEVRLSSSGRKTIGWIIGGFYTYENSDGIANLVPYNVDGSLFPLNLLTADLPSTYEEVSGFGNVTVNLSEKFDVTGGLRYAHNRQSYTQNNTGILAPSSPTRRSKEGVVTYLANARYRFNPRATVYVRYATGYRPGGPNLVTVDPLTGAQLGAPTFKSDTLSSYEVGFRGETRDGSFGIDAAVYRIDWKDILISGVRNGINTYINASRAKIDGGELTLTARPSRSVTVVGAFAYQNARLSADAPDLGGRKGDSLPNVPQFTAALNADYRAAGGGLKPTVGGTLRFVSDRNAGFDGNPNLPQYDLGDYATVDLRAGLTFGSVVAQAFVRNLLDERGAISAQTVFSSLGGPIRVAVVQPRTIGVSLSSHF